MTTEAIPTDCKQNLKGHQEAVHVVRFNHNGNYCVSGSADRSLKLWNPHTGKLVKTYNGHGWEILDLTINQDNSQIISCGGDRQIFIWDVGTGGTIRRLRGHVSRVNCVVYGAEYSVLVSGGYDKAVKIWDCRSNNQEPIQVLSDAVDSVTSLTIWHHGPYITSGSVDGLVRTYDIRRGILSSDTLGQPVTSVQWSPEGRGLLISTLDSTVRLLESETGQLLASFTGHVNTQYKISSTFSGGGAEGSGGSLVASGSEDGRVLIWDLSSQEVVATLKGHAKAACSLSYHPTDPFLLSASSDGTIKLWGPS